VTAPLVRMVAQRHPADCGVSALAMLLGVSYEDALIALGGEVPTILRRGVWYPELRKAAKHFGATLVRKPKWDAESDEGIVRVTHRRKGWAHVVLLRGGLFWDTDLSVWEPDDYLKAKAAKAGPLFYVLEES
jgi:hypothetical protein